MTKKILSLILIILMFFGSSSLAFAKQKKADYIREMQTHTFDTGDVSAVMLAAVSVLQDSGFKIEDIDFSIGYLRAKKTFKEKYSSKKRIAGWSTVLAATTAYTIFSYGTTVGQMINPTRRVMNELRDKTFVIDSNVIVESCEDNKVNVRFSFVEKVLQNADGFSFTKSAPVKVIRVYKPKVYEEFFAQMKGKIFYEKN
ncbi:hypothetical protein IJ579_04320 [bacterium]|nr:hypothetical protein [bacterium]